MKKMYQAPTARMIVVGQRYQLMAGSFEPETLRNVEGDPTNNGIPTSVKSSSLSPIQDMFGHGQDDGGIRSREFDWED